MAFLPLATPRLLPMAHSLSFSQRIVHWGQESTKMRGIACRPVGGGKMSSSEAYSSSNRTRRCSSTTSTPSKALVVLCLFVPFFASCAGAVGTECEYEDCVDIADPQVGDLTLTGQPLPTPANEDPDLNPLGTGVIKEVDCSNPGTSSAPLLDCPATGKTQDIRIWNMGRTTIRLFFIRLDGSLEERFLLRPGEKRRAGVDSCIGHRWMVKSLCGDCMAVIRVLTNESEVVKVSNDGIEALCPGHPGEWSELRHWDNGVVAAALANIPGTNRVLGFSALQDGSFSRLLPEEIPRKEAKVTQVELYDYDSDTFIEKDLHGHNMFCAALTLLPDGKLFAQGGGLDQDGKLVSTFDPFLSSNGTWETHPVETHNGHWYGTAVVTTEQRILLALGVDTKEVGFMSWSRVLDFPELSDGFDFTKPWQNMTGVDLDGKQPDILHWYPVLHLMPNGDILESGTMNNMWKINTKGTGSIEFAGKRNKARDEREAWGSSTIMFEKGKLLTVGGIENYQNDTSPGRSINKRAIVIDMNDPDNIRTFATRRMSYKRAFVNTVVLPSGEVLIVGGKNNRQQWNDTLSVRAAELWSPITQKWSVLAEQVAPRNYHAAAILLRDGRVLSAGGGLCGECDIVDSAGNKLNQPTSEIFSPPYLFDSKGEKKNRPVISEAPQTTRVRRNMKVVVTGPTAGNITRVSIVKQCAVTHTLSSDARQLRLSILRKRSVSPTKCVYRVRTDGNINVMTPGYWFLFVLDETGTPSVATDLKVLI